MADFGRQLHGVLGVFAGLSILSSAALAQSAPVVGAAVTSLISIELNKVAMDEAGAECYGYFRVQNRMPTNIETMTLSIFVLGPDGIIRGRGQALPLNAIPAGDERFFIYLLAVGQCRSEVGRIAVNDIVCADATGPLLGCRNLVTTSSLDGAVTLGRPSN